MEHQNTKYIHTMMMIMVMVMVMVRVMVMVMVMVLVVSEWSSTPFFAPPSFSAQKAGFEI